MQFALLIYHGTTPLPGTPEWASLPKEEQKAIYVDYDAWNKSVESIMTPVPPLGLPENATTVRVENGSTVTTAGPYVDVKGAVGGVGVLEVENLDAAIAIASRVPQARLGGAVEVRPCAKYW